MACSGCGSRKSKPVATLRSSSNTQTYTYTSPSGATTSGLTRPQADTLRSSSGGQGRITPE